MEMGNILNSIPEYAFYIGVFAICFALRQSKKVKSVKVDNKKMSEIAGHIRDGAMMFLKREYSLLVWFVFIVGASLAWIYNSLNDGDWRIVIPFVFGALCSGIAGYLGMRVATDANYRTAHSAQKGLNNALSVAFAGGSVMGMYVVGIALFGVAVLYGWLEGVYAGDLEKAVNILIGFSLGASSIALFARVGGGIYTKAADVGADLVGKVEMDIPEDDPRNPATIADNVGDNVGDVAGMGADLFESYVGAMIGAMILAFTLTNYTLGHVMLPLAFASIGIVCSVIGTFMVKTEEGGNPQHALDKGSVTAGVLFVVSSYFLTHTWIPTDDGQNIFWTVVAGLGVGIIVGKLTEYYTSDETKPAQGIAKDSLTGSATNIISGLSVGMVSTAYPVIAICAGIVIANSLMGLYGIAIAAVGMLATLGIQLAVDAYGPIADNAGGIAEMAGLPKEVRERTDKLDAVGNTTAAVGKGFAIGSAALTSLALFAGFMAASNLEVLNVANPQTLAGMLLGGMLPFLFSSMAMTAVGKAAYEMVEEVRRQFKEIPGLLAGKAQADYARCVDISTQGALRQMVMPGLLAILSPILVGKIGGAEMLGGLLAGSLTSGVMMAIFMANSGGAWDNAKKYIEKGSHGGKGSEAHKAAVVGDTVGDPFKDTAGPSLNILLKLMAVVSLVIAPFVG